MRASTIAQQNAPVKFPADFFFEICSNQLHLLVLVISIGTISIVCSNAFCQSFGATMKNSEDGTDLRREIAIIGGGAAGWSGRCGAGGEEEDWESEEGFHWSR